MMGKDSEFSSVDRDCASADCGWASANKKHAEQTLTKAITLGRVRRMNSSVANRRLRYYRRQTLEYYLGDGGRQSRIVTQGVVTSILSGRKIGGYAGRQASRSLNR